MLTHPRKLTISSTRLRMRHAQSQESLIKEATTSTELVKTPLPFAPIMDILAHLPIMSLLPTSPLLTTPLMLALVDSAAIQTFKR